ncbi:MAG TPA: plastocyanin/azurin family copper-binding protein, partial [Nitrospiraceae bacterium]|nr:plastocyanin/azurin family copper-binding protein [Nitrospiraceae bacterium]
KTRRSERYEMTAVTILLPTRAILMRSRSSLALRALSAAIGLLLSLQGGPAQAAWNPGDLVIDYGVSLSDGERLVVVDAAAVGSKFTADLLWQVDPVACRAQALADLNRDGIAEWADVRDDGVFRGRPAHARTPLVEALALVAEQGLRCEIGAKPGEFLTVSTAPGPTIRKGSGATQPPIGATVLVLRATSFYLPREVRVKVGEKVIWFYADGSREPHTVTSGACRGSECSGGDQAFASGPSLLKPGDRFDHTFTRPGTYPYHCDFHTITMQGTVIVQP